MWNRWFGSLRLILACSATLFVVAEKDSSYWPAGTSNPNVDLKMYWQDSYDVLHDLKKFHRLYVRYHNCAFSPFGEPSNYQENVFNKSYWYLGLTQPYRANVAFSLYGVLKGKRDQGCSKATFINSFFTMYGAQTFVEALQLNGDLGGTYYDIFGQNGFTSLCERTSANYSSTVTPGQGETQFPNSVSYTLACDAWQRFEIDSYSGVSCDQRKSIGTYKTLDEQNEQLEEVDCALLYDSDKSERYWYEDYITYSEGGYIWNESTPEISQPLDLLKFSRSCSPLLYPAACPDPYGIPSQYEENNIAGMQKAYYQMTKVRKNNTPWVVMLSFGLVMAAISFALDASLRRKIQRAKAARKKVDDTSTISDQSIVDKAGCGNAVFFGKPFEDCRKMECGTGYAFESANGNESSWAARPIQILSAVGEFLFSEKRELVPDKPTEQPHIDDSFKAPSKAFSVYRTVSAPAALGHIETTGSGLSVADEISLAVNEMVTTVKDSLVDVSEGNEFKLMQVESQSHPNNDGNQDSGSNSGSDKSNSSRDGLIISAEKADTIRDGLIPASPENKAQGLLKRILSRRSSGGWS